MASLTTLSYQDLLQCAAFVVLSLGLRHYLDLQNLLIARALDGFDHSNAVQAIKREISRPEKNLVEKKKSEPCFEPRAAGREARALPLCCAIPSLTVRTMMRLTQLPWISGWQAGAACRQT